MNDNPLFLHGQLIRAIAPSYRYRGGDVKAWQESARAKLIGMLGMPEKNAPDDLQIEWTKQQDGYTETRFTYQSEEGYRALAHMLLPDGVEKPMPVICLQGHSKGMHISLGRPIYPGDAESIAGGRDFALQAVRQGYAAFALEQRGFGERGGTEKGPDCALVSYTALLLGRTLLGERVFDVMRLVDVMESSFADRLNLSRVGITGNSGGGTTTFYAAAVDARLSVAAPSCAFSTYYDSISVQLHCPCNYVPNLAQAFDMGDLAGLIAPRPLIVVSGLHDVIFPWEAARDQIEISRKVYAALGAPDRVKQLVGQEGHRYYPDLAWPEINRYMKEDAQ